MLNGVAETLRLTRHHFEDEDGDFEEIACHPDSPRMVPLHLESRQSPDKVQVLAKASGYDRPPCRPKSGPWHRVASDTSGFELTCVTRPRRCDPGYDFR